MWASPAESSNCLKDREVVIPGYSMCDWFWNFPPPERSEVSVCSKCRVARGNTGLDPPTGWTSDSHARKKPRHSSKLMALYVHLSNLVTVKSMCRCNRTVISCGSCLIETYIDDLRSCSVWVWLGIFMIFRRSRCDRVTFTVIDMHQHTSEIWFHLSAGGLSLGRSGFPEISTSILWWRWKALSQSIRHSG